MHFLKLLSVSAVFLGVFFFQAPRVNGQIENDKFSVTAELLLPSGMASKPFRSYLNGLVNVHPKFQYKPAKHIYVALGPKYMYYTVAEFKVPIKTNGGMHAYGGGIEAGYSTWITERFGIELGVKAGAMQHQLKTDLMASAYKLNAMYVEPSLSLILASDEAVAYRWIVGYNWMGFDLMPHHLGFNTNGGYSADDFKVGAQSIVFGFGMTYYFKNQRSDVFIDDDSEK